MISTIVAVFTGLLFHIESCQCDALKYYLRVECKVEVLISRLRIFYPDIAVVQVYYNPKFPKILTFLIHTTKVADEMYMKRYREFIKKLKCEYTYRCFNEETGRAQKTGQPVLSIYSNECNIMMYCRISYDGGPPSLVERNIFEDSSEYSKNTKNDFVCGYFKAIKSITKPLALNYQSFNSKVKQSMYTESKHYGTNRKPDRMSFHFYYFLIIIMILIQTVCLILHCKQRNAKNDDTERKKDLNAQADENHNE